MTLSTEQQADGLRIRTARKHWRCEGHLGYNEAAGKVLRCGKPITPGTRHLEYLGESHAFESGPRYCRTCALREWRVRL